MVETAPYNLLYFTVHPGTSVLTLSTCIADYSKTRFSWFLLGLNVIVPHQTFNNVTFSYHMPSRVIQNRDLIKISLDWSCNSYWGPISRSCTASQKLINIKDFKNLESEIWNSNQIKISELTTFNKMNSWYLKKSYLGWTVVCQW